MHFFKRIICRWRGHTGEWRQHYRAWRLYRQCERCDHIEYALKPEYADKVSAWLSRGGYPESAKLMRNAKVSDGGTA